MRPEDITDVGQVEKECFPTPWPASAYRRELRNTVGNHYIVVRWQADGNEQAPRPDESPPGRLPFNLFSFLQRPNGSSHPHPIVGFAGMWTMLEESHITTIGVASSHRGRHIGELLLVSLIDEALRRNANWITLEVRVSNLKAQNLYRKYGFTQYGVRKHYYSDNGEDAYIMWSPSLRSEEFRARFRDLKECLSQSLSSWTTPLPGSGAIALSSE